MSFDYAATAATAARLLQRFGAACTLKRQSAAAYDADTASAAVTETSLATYAAVFDYPQRYIDGTLIKQGDKQAFLSPDQVPAAGDRFAWQSVNYTVVAVKPVSPAGTPVLYECQVRA